MLRFLPRPAALRGMVMAMLPALAGLPVAGQTIPDNLVGATECCVTLLMDVGARAAALGGALTARGGADALFTNPASLAWLSRDEFRVHSSETEIETSTSFGLAFRIRSAGTIGMTYRLVDQGEIPAINESGVQTGTLRLLNHALVASFATTLAPGVAAGVSYKLYQERWDCRGSCASIISTTHAVDLGVQYHPPLWRALQLGASVVHLGKDKQVINAEQADPLPVRVRAGAAYELMHHMTADTITALWAHLDVAGSWHDGIPPAFGGGLELVLDETLFVRTGYSTEAEGLGGAAVGVGMKYDRFDIGISKSFVSAGAQDPYQITFAIGF